MLSWQSDLIYFLFSLISMIPAIIISGYLLSITRKTIAFEEEIPDLNLKKI